MHKLVKLILLSHSFLNWKFNQFNQTRHQNYSIFFLSFWNQWYEDYIGTNCFWVNWYRVFCIKHLFQERPEIKLYVLRKLRARGSVLNFVPHTCTSLGSSACRFSLKNKNKKKNIQALKQSNFYHKTKTTDFHPT